MPSEEEIKWTLEKIKKYHSKAGGVLVKDATPAIFSTAAQAHRIAERAAKGI